MEDGFLHWQLPSTGRVTQTLTLFQWSNLTLTTFSDSRPSCRCRNRKSGCTYRLKNNVEWKHLFSLGHTFNWSFPGIVPGDPTARGSGDLCIEGNREQPLWHLRRWLVDILDQMSQFVSDWFPDIWSLTCANDIWWMGWTFLLHQLWFFFFLLLHYLIFYRGERVVCVRLCFENNM